MDKCILHVVFMTTGRLYISSRY